MYSLLFKLYSHYELSNQVFFTIAKFFQLHANQRRRINHIGTLQVNGATLVTKEEKAETAFHYFSCILGHDP
jgi:hypothetical protein